MTITQGGEPFLVPPIAQGIWANEYADPNRQLGFWRKHETWCTVRGQIDGTERVWRILPVCHLSRHQNYDVGYQRTKEVLKQMRTTMVT
jgi:hypothetical protein